MHGSGWLSAISSLYPFDIYRTRFKHFLGGGSLVLRAIAEWRPFVQICWIITIVQAFFRLVAKSTSQFAFGQGLVVTIYKNAYQQPGLPLRVMPHAQLCLHNECTFFPVYTILFCQLVQITRNVCCLTILHTDSYLQVALTKADADARINVHNEI